MITVDTTDIDSTAAGDAPSRRRLWSHPSQRVLLLLGLGVVVGSFMPWVETPIRVFGGFEGAGRYLFYFGMLGFGAGIVPSKWLSIGQASLMAAAAMILPAWQVLRLFSAVRFDGWQPGIGLILVFGCGAFTARIVHRMIRA